MRNVSQTSNARKKCKALPTADRATTESARKRRRMKRALRWSDVMTRPKTHGRKREARRWLDVLGVRCTNGRVCERRPGAKLLTFKESQEIHSAGLAELEATDPELNKAVGEIMWENIVADLGITLEEWKVRSGRRVRRLSKVRAEMQRLGSI
jgi:hypothetical protein